MSWNRTPISEVGIDNLVFFDLSVRGMADLVLADFIAADRDESDLYPLSPANVQALKKAIAKHDEQNGSSPFRYVPQTIARKDANGQIKFKVVKVQRTLKSGKVVKWERQYPVKTDLAIVRVPVTPTPAA